MGVGSGELLSNYTQRAEVRVGPGVFLVKAAVEISVWVVITIMKNNRIFPSFLTPLILAACFERNRNISHLE